jgi:hypothetical protein
VVRRRRGETGNKRKSAFRRGRTIEPHDNPAHPQRASDDQDGAFRAADHIPRDAAHEHAPHRSMPAPAEHDRVGAESLSLIEDRIDRRLIDHDRLDIGPAARERAACAFGRGLCAAVQRRQQNGPTMLCSSPPRNHDAGACVSRPRKCKAVVTALLA